MNTTVVPFAFSAATIFGEPVDVAPGKGRRRFVQQQDARLAQQRAGDLDLLPHRQVEIAHHLMGRDAANAELAEQFGDHRCAAARPQKTRETGGLVRQQHVLPHRQVGNQREFLERSLDAEPVRVAWGTECRGWPNAAMYPLSGRISPLSSFTMVDLPAPFSPSSACTLPAGMARLTPSSATVAP